MSTGGNGNGKTAMAYPDLTLQPSFTVQSINERMVRIGKRIQNLNERGHLNLTGPITASEGVTAVVTQTGTGTTFVMNTNPMLIGPATDTLQTSGNVGIGTAPSGIAGQFLTISDAANENTASALSNTNSTGAAALAIQRIISDSATLQLISHGSARIVVRYGVTVGGYSEVDSLSGNGLIVGTRGGKPVIIGTNSIAAIIISATTQSATFAAPIILKSYTVATLPAGAVGMRAYVTNALAPAYGAAVVGGGAVVVPVFFDGVNWITA